MTNENSHNSVLDEATEPTYRRRRGVERREVVGDAASWIRRCHGYRVDSLRGRVGIVADVLYGANQDRPAALAVRDPLGRVVLSVAIGDSEF